MYLNTNELKRLALCTVSASDSGRDELKCVCLKDNYLMAADGYMLALTEVSRDQHDNLPDEVLIPTNIIKQLPEDINILLVYSLGNQECVFTPLAPETYCHYSFKPPAIKYLNILRVLPRFEKKAFITLDITKLRKLLTVMPERGNISIGIGNPIDQPIEAVCGEMRAVLMPINLHDKPEWFTDLSDFKITPDKLLCKKQKDVICDSIKKDGCCGYVGECDQKERMP